MVCKGGFSSMEVIVVILAAIIIFMLLMAIALCQVSGKISRIEEMEYFRMSMEDKVNEDK